MAGGHLTGWQQAPPSVGIGRRRLHLLNGVLYSQRLLLEQLPVNRQMTTARTPATVRVGGLEQRQ
jgi:hypothetical protein